MPTHFATYRFALTAFVALALMLALADVRGDWPINDDWAYALPVRWLARDGVLRFTNWQYMTLVGQTLLGAGWASLFGWSFESLRMLTALVAFGGVVALHRLLRGLALPAGWAGAVALGTLFSPLFAPEIASFMTDIYGWAATIAALALLFAGIEQARPRLLAAGWACALIALSVRQTAIAIPIAFLVADLAYGTPRRRALVRGLPPLVVMVVLIALYPLVVARTTGLPTLFSEPTRQLADVLGSLAHLRLGALRPVLGGLADGSLYIGLLAIPVAAMLWVSRARPAWLPVGAIGALLAMIAALRGRPLPVPGNVLQPWGLGPRDLIGMDAGASAGPGWWLVTLLACLSIAPILVAGWTGWRRRGVRSCWREAGLLAGAATAYAPLILIYGPWLDRHVLLGGTLAIAAGVGLAVGGRSVLLPRAAILFVGLTGIAATLLLHDYFAWNRARWAAAAAMGRPAMRIDGGFEYDSLARHADDPAAPLPDPRRWRDRSAPCGLSEYAAPAGSVPVAKVQVKRWLPIGGRAIIGQTIIGWCRPA